MTYHFEPVDVTQVRLTGQLSSGQRLQRMLDARELAVGLIRGRLTLTTSAGRRGEDFVPDGLTENQVFNLLHTDNDLLNFGLSGDPSRPEQAQQIGQVYHFQLMSLAVTDSPLIIT